MQTVLSWLINSIGKVQLAQLHPLPMANLQSQTHTKHKTRLKNIEKMRYSKLDTLYYKLAYIRYNYDEASETMTWWNMCVGYKFKI